jgi:hypothetical protein
VPFNEITVPCGDAGSGMLVPQTFALDAAHATGSTIELHIGAPETGSNPIMNCPAGQLTVRDAGLAQIIFLLAIPVPTSLLLAHAMPDPPIR